MKGKLKVYLLAILSVCIFLFCGMAACSKENKIKLNGFEIQETLNVEYGSLVTLESPIITDEDGNFYEPMVDVCDSKGGYVVVESNSFRAWDEAGYTITYVVRVNKEYFEIKETQVTVTNRQSLSVTAEYNDFEDTGKAIFINPVCEIEGVNYDYAVKNLKTSATVDVTTENGDVFFTCEEVGNYEVTISATKGERSGSYGYTIIVRKAVENYVIEHFDSQWKEIAEYLGDERMNYNIVKGSEVGLTDRYGDDAYFLAYTSNNEYLPLHIRPRFEKAEYEALLADGYDQVSVYCYIVSAQNASHEYVIRTGTNGFYQRSNVTSYPNVWNEITMNFDLISGSEISRSFLYCYDMYKSQDVFFLSYLNEGSLATRDTLTLYYTDILVTKPVDVTAKEGIATEYVTGDSVKLNSLFNSAVDLRYYVTFRGDRKEVSGDYVFTANGEYTVEALPARKDYRGFASVKLNVTDGFTATSEYVAEKRSAETVTVYLENLQTSFVEKDGIIPTVNGYAVYDRNGKAYAVGKDNTFVADADGVYMVEVKGDYELDGLQCSSYTFVELDVWSDANAYQVVSVVDMFTTCPWAYQSNQVQKTTVAEYTVDGVTGEMFRLQRSNDGMALTVRPFYSKSYYQNLIETTEGELVFSLNAYFESGAQTSANMDTSRSIFSNYMKYQILKDTWTTQVASLSAFVENYDGLLSGYQLMTENVKNKVKYGYEVNGAWKDYLLYAELRTRADYVYITDIIAQPIITATEVAIVERTGDTVLLNDFESAFENTDFVPAEILSASKNGVSVVASGNFIQTGTEDGVYDLIIRGTKNEESVFMSLQLDVWSQATKYVVAQPNDVISVGGYGYQSNQKETVWTDEYTVGGKTGTFARITPSKESSVVVIKPLHSKKYYEQLLANESTYTSYVTMSWYFENTSEKTSKVTPYYHMFSGYVNGEGAKDEWLTGKISLADFVELYDDMTAIYERTVNEIALGTKYGRFVDKTGVVDISGTQVYGYLMATKFTGRMDNAYFSALTITQEIKTEQAATMLVDRTKTDSVDLSSSLSSNQTLAYWKNQGYTLSYSVTARYGGATTEGATFAITDTVENGVYYLQVTATKGAESGVCYTQTIDIYNSTEPVEYENFRHTDSQYAVQAYYGARSFITTANTTTTMGSAEQHFDLTNTLYSISTGTGSEENTLYAMSFGTVDALTGYTGSTIGYVAFDLSQTTNFATSYEYIYVYVLPRHSKAYYELYAQTYGKFVTAFKGENGLRQYTTVGISGDTLNLRYQKTWGAGNQVTGIQTDMQMTAQTLVDNYTAFASGQIPMYIIYSPYDCSTGTARLYEITFTKNA